ncbi:MAG: DUF393 domain-containing protein [Salaquimonas sp.]
MEKDPNIEVFYDGECPICRWEIAFYSKRDKTGKIRWTDIISLCAHDLPSDKTASDLLGKFHVRDLPAQANDQWHIGVDAFARIWHELPVFKRFSFVFAVPGLRQLAEFAYRLFLKWQAKDRAKRTHGS